MLYNEELNKLKDLISSYYMSTNNEIATLEILNEIGVIRQGYSRGTLVAMLYAYKDINNLKYNCYPQYTNKTDRFIYMNAILKELIENYPDSLKISKDINHKNSVKFFLNCIRFYEIHNAYTKNVKHPPLIKLIWNDWEQQ